MDTLNAADALHVNGACLSRALLPGTHAQGGRHLTGWFANAVERTREQAMDTSLMVVLGDIGLQLAKSLTPGQQKATPGELLGHLRARYAPSFAVADGDSSQPLPPSAFDWRALGAAVSKFFRTAHSSGPHMCVALGAGRGKTAAVASCAFHPLRF